MFDYKSHFDQYCKDHDLDLTLSYQMPAGYETAYGTFDAASGTVFIHAAYLKDAPDHEKAFYLFHELRHASQYLSPERFSSAVSRSIQYVIQYDGTCYKVINGKYHACRLEGGEARFTDLYLGQPHEADANSYAYRRAKDLFGDSEDLRKLYAFWMPNQPVSEEAYPAIYAEIDASIDQKS